MSCAGDKVIIEMNLRHRRLLQTVSLAVLLAYTALFVYQTLSRGAGGVVEEVSRKNYHVDHWYSRLSPPPLVDADDGVVLVRGGFLPEDTSTRNDHFNLSNGEIRKCHKFFSLNTANDRNLLRQPWNKFN